MRVRAGHGELLSGRRLQRSCGESWRHITSCRTEQVLVTAGSTALLSLLCQTLLEPGLNAVTSERSFIVYSMAVQAAGAQSDRSADA